MTAPLTSKPKSASDIWLVLASLVYVTFVAGCVAMIVWILWRASFHG